MFGKPIALIQVPNKRLFSRREAAGYLGMHPDTLDTEIRAGRIRAYVNGGKLKLRLEDLEDYVESLQAYNPIRGEALEEGGLQHGSA